MTQQPGAHVESLLNGGAGEMAQALKALVALADDSDSVSNTHMVAINYL